MRITVRMLLVVSILMLSTAAAQAQESTDVQSETADDNATDIEEGNSPDPVATSVATDAATVEETAAATGDEALAVEANSSVDATETALNAPALSVSTVSVKDESWKGLNPAYSEQSILPIFGKAMYYNPGVMDRVYKNRIDSGRIQPCPECIGRVAMLRAGDLNRKVWIQLPDQTLEGPFLVVDVADVKHVGMLLEKEWAIDVDYETARRWRMFNPRYVTVLPELTSVVDVTMRPKREFSIDIYRSEKMGHNNQTTAYFGGADELYVK